LIWLQLDKLTANDLKRIKELILSFSGYLTVVKIEESLKSSVDIFSIDEIRYKISEKIKESFDPKRILNPGKMYSGI
jgi:glycolate oxidase FAD binding subunit